MTRIRTTKKISRLHRHRRIRARVFGTAQRPRLAVFRSSKHVYAQLIDDAAQRTLLAAYDRDFSLKENKGRKKPQEIAFAVGEWLGGRAREAGISEAVFDRGGFAYHGRVKALAEGARKAGLRF